MSYQAKKHTRKTSLNERWCIPLCSVQSVCDRVEVTIMHAASTSDACEMHTKSVEESSPSPLHLNELEASIKHAYIRGRWLQRSAPQDQRPPRQGGFGGVLKPRKL